VILGTAEDQVKACDANDKRCVGVMEESTVNAGDAASVVVSMAKRSAIAGAAIVAFDRVKVLNGGKFTPGNAADVETVGYASTPPQRTAMSSCSSCSRSRRDRNEVNAWRPCSCGGRRRSNRTT
jgi:hypothetical protein